MEIREMEIGALKPYANNPRNNDKAVEAVAESIREFGFKVPIVIDKDGTIVAGHTRYKAAQRLGLGSVPCIVADDLTPEQVKAFRLADNRTAELAEWDFQALEEEIRGLEGIFDMEGFGFDMKEIESEASKLKDEGAEASEDGFDAEEALGEIDEPTTKPGDIWILGGHRLICGDSTKRETLEALMVFFGEGIQADMVVTDPPYNVAYEGGTADRLRIENDDMDSASFEAFLTKAFSCMKDALKPGGAFYIWHGDLPEFDFLKSMEACGLNFRQHLVWKKNSPCIGRSDYQWKHELCFYGWKEGAAHYFVDSRTETTVIEMDKPTRNADHPTMKPVPLFGYLIKNSSRRGEIVLDPFCGSGTAVVACEQLGRRAAVAELDPKYCDVIVRRWEALTGKKAELRRKE